LNSGYGSSQIGRQAKKVLSSRLSVLKGSNAKRITLFAFSLVFFLFTRSLVAAQVEFLRLFAFRLEMGFFSVFFLLIDMQISIHLLCLPV